MKHYSHALHRLAYQPAILKQLPSTRKPLLHTLLRTFTSTHVLASSKHYDYLVIGGGSGGISSARRAAKYGAKTLLVESNVLGGACVNVGCIPKKVMWSAGTISKALTEARGYGFDGFNGSEMRFNWPAFKKRRDMYVEDLSKSFEQTLEMEGIECRYGRAKFIDNGTVQIDLKKADEHGNRVEQVTANHILIATGGTPRIPQGIPGAELGINSDGFFALEQQPKRVAVVGAGYIGVELAGILNSVGTETHMIIRQDKLLGSFDSIITDTITEVYEKKGIQIHKNVYEIQGITKQADGSLKVDITNTNSIVVDELIWTIGRCPEKDALNLPAAGVALNKNGTIHVDEYQNTTARNVYSVGDVVGIIDLTPTAIAAGRKLAMRLFAGDKYKSLKQDYSNVPSAVFSHPEGGSIGLSEQEARQKYGAQNIKVYTTKFTEMHYAVLDKKQQYQSIYKLVCKGPEEKIVGLHLVGDGVSEMLQGFSVAVKMGATKQDFDNCVAIHPTNAEELVTMV